MNKLLHNIPSVINLGLESFVTPIQDAGADVTHLQWIPPANGNAKASMSGAKLMGNAKIEAANTKALDAMLASSPVLIGVGIAKDLIPAMDKKLILHSGPPIAWADMCGPVQGAIAGAILFEKWADNIDDAFVLAASGAVQFDACHHHAAVGPMAGIISPSMPLWIVEDKSNGHKTFSNMNEGLGKVLRFGANSLEVINRLEWMKTELAPCIAKALEYTGPLVLKPMMAQALHMGDEIHNRNNAATSLFYKFISLGVLQTSDSAEIKEKVLGFIASNDHFFLNISMAASKAMADAAHGFENSTIVTAMSRNGVEFGIRVSGMGNMWFKAPSPVVEGLYFAGYGQEDSAADLGDSTITETVGLGGFSMASAPAIVKFVNGTPKQAVKYSKQMFDITHGTNSAFTLPMLNFCGIPAGIDLLKVIDTNILPVINTGIAHKEAGIGQIGAGITFAPMQCFTNAVEAMAEKLCGSKS